jgi:hypothetical protein
MIYTEKDQTVKDRTVKQAIDAARVILYDRHNVKGFKPKGIILPPETKITLQEMNAITDQVIREYRNS